MFVNTQHFDIGQIPRANNGDLRDLLGPITKRCIFDLQDVMATFNIQNVLQG